jgi:hypothetical protein
MSDTPNYPNERDCEHGRFRPKCEICQLERELADMTARMVEARALAGPIDLGIIAKLKQERDEARDALREMRDLIVLMNFGDGFPAITRAVEGAELILSNAESEASK